MPLLAPNPGDATDPLKLQYFQLSTIGYLSNSCKSLVDVITDVQGLPGDVGPQGLPGLPGAPVYVDSSGNVIPDSAHTLVSSTHLLMTSR